MKEKEWWSKKLQPVMHVPSRGRCAKKVQDAFQRGRPDVDYCDNGSVSLIELKYTDQWPIRGGALRWSGEQVKTQKAWMRDWVKCGGYAFFLLGVGDKWYLMSVDTPCPATREEIEITWCLIKGDITNLKPLLVFLRHEPRTVIR